MIGSFKNAVKMKYVIAAGPLPSEDYPPKHIAEWMKICEGLGRKDLADQIKMQWHKVLNKYPQARFKWETAVPAATNSLKKNIFGGKEFVEWLAGEQDLSSAEKKEATHVSSLLPPKPAGLPAIAVPKKDETTEDWASEAAKTKEVLLQNKKAFTDINDYISYLEKEANDLKRKISDYGPGGSKSKTKKGEPSSYSARVPKWEATLSAFVDQLEETKKNFKEVAAEFKAAANAYNHSPVVTVGFEKKSQDSLANILTYVLNMSDLDKQRELLAKLNETLEKQGTTASVEEVVAGDILQGLFTKLKNVLKTIKEWVLGIKTSVKAFDKLANIY